MSLWRERVRSNSDTYRFSIPRGTNVSGDVAAHTRSRSCSLCLELRQSFATINPLRPIRAARRSTVKWMRRAMSRETQQLFEPISTEAPCGVDLEDSQTLASLDAFRLFGQLVPREGVKQSDWAGLKAKTVDARG